MRRQWAVAAMAAAGVVLAAGWTRSIASADTMHAAPAWVMIQGRVSQRSAQWATVVTPPWQPYCPPGTMCPMVIMAGRTYRVRLMGAVAETASGMPNAAPMRVGEQVVVAGTPMSPDHSSTSSSTPLFQLQAKVWEELQPTTTEPVPCLRSPWCGGPPVRSLPQS